MPRLASKITGLVRWRPWRRQASAAEAVGRPPEDPLLAVGRQLRQQREAHGLSLRQLALETRISTPVLEALERGWRDRLPEAAYLRSMLPLIEQRLELPAHSLQAALPPQRLAATERDRGHGGLLLRFTPGSIDVFSSWQGTVLYGALTLGLIYALNLHQQQLAAAHLLTLRPIPPLPERDQSRPAEAGGQLLHQFPDLRPLQQADRGVALGALRRALSNATTAAGPGTLELSLSRASQISLSSDSGQRTNLQGAQGQLLLHLQPPLQLSITPAPGEAEVRWNGAALPPIAGQPGRYRLPQRP